MTIKHSVFDVEYDFPETGVAVVSVRVIMADRLAAELRGRKYGLTDTLAQPQLTGFLWLYFAMTRSRIIAAETTFAEFELRCLDNGKAEEEPVPPTTAESADSASASPSLSLPSTGSPSSSPATTD